jgi:hypothetical protein
VEEALWLVGLVLVVFLLDRALLWAESRGWIYYRVRKPGRGASTYHLLEWNSAFDPTMRQVQEEILREEKSEDEAGDPLGGGKGTDGHADPSLDESKDPGKSED